MARFSHLPRPVKIDREPLRARMVELHLARRGIEDPKVLNAFRSVAREEFVPEGLAEFAYEDSPLPIDEHQTISQPYVVAFTAQSLSLKGGERILEVGTGSGYAAAILGQIGGKVFTVERLPALADSAKQRLARLGFENVHVALADGSLGWPEFAPYDAIAVAAGGPMVPPALLNQLAVGGRLVIPVGPNEDTQLLKRITRTGESEFREEDLLDVRFVPLIGEQAWQNSRSPIVPPSRSRAPSAVASLVREVAEPIDDIDNTPIDALIERIGDARVVLLGESTHGTSEFYRMRARITRELIARKGFQIVAVEADWPDAAQIGGYVRGGTPISRLPFTPFTRFPTWMWRNADVLEFVEWIRLHNSKRRDSWAGFYGLDLYSMFTSIAAVLTYLDDVDPMAARVARHRYGSLTPWQKDPAAYGEAVLVGKCESAEHDVVSMLRGMLSKRVEYANRDGERFFDATKNAELVADAEHYYRAMYYGSAASWNLRDDHMFRTLCSLLEFHGPKSKAIVWEHNSHVGDALATEMSVRGEHNVGQLCRAKFRDGVYIVGFGTDHGTVAAASNWGEPMQKMNVVPARTDSYESVFHDSGLRAFTLPLREPAREAVRDELSPPLLERAIGVVYRPKTERQSHYFTASLPRQFDEYIWFDESEAVRPLEAAAPTPFDGLPSTATFGF